MTKTSKIAAITAASVVAAYFGLTWFYFGSPHPCTIAARVIEWESAEQSEEQWLEFARNLAILNVSYSKLEQPRKDKLAEELKTAPREVVERYLAADFTPESIAHDAIEATKKDTPASCVQILYVRLKNAFARRA